MSHVSRFTFYVSRHSSLVTYATLLVAFFLRVYRLADKNIWWDEGWSIWLSRQDLAAIALRTAADEHPPLHYWVLHFWNLSFGADAFAGRFLSVAFGVLTIALIYRIGKRVGGAWLGILAALFLATARFHIWWSQDIKNYTPSIFFAFASVWFGLRLIADGKWQMAGARYLQSVIGYSLLAAVALMTHYLAALVLLALNVYAAFVLLVDQSKIENRKSKIVNWFLANALAAALFAPWLFLYLQNAQAWSAAPAFDFGLFLKLVATVLPLGVTTNIENYAGMTIALTTLVVLGVISNQLAVNSEQSSVNSKRSLITDHWLLFTLIILLPPLLIYALSLTPVAFFAPKIQPRYLVILVPAYAMLLAFGIATLRKFSIFLALAATLFILAGSAFVLNDYYAERRLRDEYATLVNTINAFARQGDVVLLDTDQEWPTFLYYLRAPLDPPSNLGVSWIGAPNGAAMNVANADSIVQRALARNSAVWLVTIPDALATDPQRLLETRLARDFAKQYERVVGDKRLMLYAPAPRDFVNISRENFTPQYARAEQVDLNAQLIGFDLPTRELNAGDTLRLVTYWRAAFPAMVSVRLSGLITTTLQMPSGELLRYETDFVIPPTASGDFAVMVNQIELARVNVEPRAPSRDVVFMAPFPLDVRFGDALRLIGYDLPQTKFRAGESVSLTLYWRTERSIEKNYLVFVHLLGTEYNPAQNNFLWGQVDRVPRAGAYPTTAWKPNEVVTDAYRVPIDLRAPAGSYKIEVGLYDAATGARLAMADGQDSVIIAEIQIAR